MNKKIIRNILICIIVLSSLMLSGCTKLVDLTEQESDILVEYMADIVLEYEESYEEALIYPDKGVEEASMDELEEAAEVTNATDDTNVTNAKKDNTDTGKDTASIGTKSSEKEETYEVNNIKFVDDIGNGNFNITYKNYTLSDTYPKDMKNTYFILETTDEKQLLIVTFDITNLSDKTKRLNLIDSKIKYQLKINNRTTYNPMLTLLTDDIQYINLDIAAGKTQKAVVVFDVLRDTNISNLDLNIINQGKTASIKMK